MGKNRTWKTILTAMLLLLSISSVFSQDNDERKVVRVAFPEQTGMSQVSKTGSLAGYNYDYLEKVSEFTGWKMEYIQYVYDDGNEAVMAAMNDLMEGKVDLLGPMLMSTYTKNNFECAEYSYGTVYTTLATDIGSTLRRSTMDTNYVYKIGLWRQATQRNAEVMAYLESDNILHEIYYFDSAEEQQEALHNGTVDMISALSLSPYSNTRIFARFAPRPYYFVSTKGNSELIEELDNAICMISEMHPSLQDNLFETYFNDRIDSFYLSDSQRESFKDIGTIRVLCLDMDAPYVYSNNGEAKGALVSIIEDFAAELGLETEFVFCASIPEAIDHLSDKEHDLIIGMPFTSEFCAENGLVRTDPIFSSGIGYVRNSNNDNYAQQTIATVKGYETSFGDIQFGRILSFDNTEECVLAVKSGKADMAIGDRSNLDYYLFETNSNMISFVVDGQIHNVTIAVSKDNALSLLRELNNFINSLSSNTKSTYLEKGNHHDYVMTLQRLISQNPRSAAIVAAVFALLAILYVMKIRGDKRKLQKLNQSLDQARIEADQANNSKSRFLSSVSHDIRTPMNAIIGFTLLAENNVTDSDKVKDYLGKIRFSGEQLLCIINDVLDMSRIESGKVRLEETEVNLIRALEKLRTLFGVQASEKDVTLEMNTDSVKDSDVLCDTTRLGQLLMNLLSNAIKFTPAGGNVSVNLAQLPSETEGTGMYEIRVKDNGIGMSQEFAQTIFEPFEREQTSTVSGIQGTGLGMAISKNIVDMMGGSIEVQTEKGKGTEFIVRIQLKLQDKSSSTDKGKADDASLRSIEEITDFRGKRILLAEDNELNREIATEILSGYGFEVDPAENGEIAVTKLENSEPGHYSLVLMDIQMPVLDGYGATERIRALENKALREIPIIAMTANSFEEDRKAALDHKMDGFLSKPVNIDALMEVLLSVFKA